MFCGSVGIGRSGKGRDTEEIDKAMSHFGETLMKLAKTAEETLRNEIWFCQRGNWYDRCIVEKNHDEHLLLRPGCSKRHYMIAMFFSHDHHLHNLATEPSLYEADMRR